MITYLYGIDVLLFRFFNGILANPVFDIVMPFITEPRYWMPIYILTFVYLLWRGKAKGRTAAILLIITILISDQVNSQIIKELFGRLRPCHTLSRVHLLVGCGGGKSFPSSHAVNNFAAAVILSYFFGRQKWIFFTLASLVAFSRVYVGVHYPSDILGGAVLGSAFAGIIIFNYYYIMKYINKINHEKTPSQRNS